MQPVNEPRPAPPRITDLMMGAGVQIAPVPTTPDAVIQDDDDVTIVYLCRVGATWVAVWDELDNKGRIQALFTHGPAPDTVLNTAQNHIQRGQ